MYTLPARVGPHVRAPAEFGADKRGAAGFPLEPATRGASNGVSQQQGGQGVDEEQPGSVRQS